MEFTYRKRNFKLPSSFHAKGIMHEFHWYPLHIWLVIGLCVYSYTMRRGGGNPHPFYLRPAEDVTTWDLRHALSPMCLTLTCFAFRKNVLICIGNISLKIVFISFRQRQAGTIGFN